MNLTSEGGSQIITPDDNGFVYQCPTIIPGTDDLMVEEVASPDFSNDVNNNAMSSVLILDPNGKILRRYEQFNFTLQNTGKESDCLQFNPSTSTAWTYGQFAMQLQPFSYDGSTAARAMKH